MYPKSLKTLIEYFKMLPGIGEKTAERLAFSVLSFDKDDIDGFSLALKDVNVKIKRCKICNNISESDVCEICSDETRQKDTICVVEDAKSVILFEKIGTYRGLYHVLDGLISPLEGINPGDINVSSLTSRVDNEDVKELVLAVKPSIEGETTSLYIVKLFENSEVTVSKIAHGVPLGADMEYIDSMTLEMALEDRKKIS